MRHEVLPQGALLPHGHTHVHVHAPSVMAGDLTFADMLFLEMGLLCVILVISEDTEKRLHLGGGEGNQHWGMFPEAFLQMEHFCKFCTLLQISANGGPPTFSQRTILRSDGRQWRQWLLLEALLCDRLCPGDLHLWLMEKASSPRRQTSSLFFVFFLTDEDTEVIV